MLTKKDFKAVAEIIKNNTAMADDVVCLETDPDFVFEVKAIRIAFATDFENYFATQNPRFDRERFMKACGLN